MKKILIFLILCLLSLVLLSGCSNESKGKNRNVEGPPTISYEKSESIEAAIFIDGTYSMAGYVNSPSTTVYGDALKGIERTITGTWKKEQIQYVKFGDSIQEINRNQFLQTNNVNFYQEKDTSLQTVIDVMDDKKLNILVTDLFQTNQDMDSLIISLKKKCFSDEKKALALIGVKSQFNGTIFDIGKNLASFKYATSEDIVTYRPFYLMVMGQENDVRAFTNAYLKNINNDKLTKVTLFSKHLGTDVELAAGKSVINNKDKTNKISNMAKISTLLGSNSNVLQYRLKLDEKQSGFNAVLEAKNVLSNAPSEFASFSAVVEKWDNKGKNDAKFVAVNDKDFIKVSGTDLGLHDGNANMNLSVVFNPLGIKKAEGKYRINMSLFPNKQIYIDNSNVFDEWSFTDDAAINAEALQQVGGKTLNISNFARLLANLNYEMNKPGFYNIYVYLEAK